MPDEVAVFLFENGRLRGPAAFSTVGMRIQNEHSGSSSLFAQPMAIEPIPEAPEIGDQESGIRLERAEEMEPMAEDDLPEPLPAGDAASEARFAKINRGLLEARMETALAELAEPSASITATVRQGHLALLKRWYYRPEARRTGEIFFPGAEGHWPLKAVLRGVGRVASSRLKPPSSCS